MCSVDYGHRPHTVLAPAVSRASHHVVPPQRNHLPTLRAITQQHRLTRLAAVRTAWPPPHVAQSSGRRRRRAPRKRVEGGWWSTFSWPQLRRCLGMCTGQLRRARQLIRTTVLPSFTHHHYVRTPQCLQQLLSSLFRRACAAGLLLRLPTSQPEQATAGSAAAGHAGGQEATCRGRS